MARPSKLTADVREKLVQAIAAGATLKDAAAFAGIGKTTFDRYREQDKALDADLEAAEGRAAVCFVSVINKAAQEGDWRAAAWWLERRRTVEWGRRDALALTGQGGGPIQVEEEAKWDLSRLSNEQLRTLYEIQKIAIVDPLAETVSKNGAR